LFNIFLPNKYPFTGFRLFLQKKQMAHFGLFCGGFSSEFDISMLSAGTIEANFPTNHTLVKIVVKPAGWYAMVDGENYPFSLDSCSYSLNGKETKIDAGIIYIHGNPGENGKIQSYLDIKGIPYANSSALASELSFDKWYCNQFLKNFGIPVAKSLFLRDRNEFSNEYIIEELGLPCFVKPSDSGSSFGISKVNAAEELENALNNAFKEGKTIVIESFLKGTEVTCGLYRTKTKIHTLPLTEIVSENDFFDYEAKYQGKSQEITPARIDNEIRNLVWESSKKIYDLLQLKSIARIDFMLVDNIPYVIEVNTTPGFSSASLVPQMLAHDKIEICDFWKEIIAVELGL
jgi:D-alanine-D-alanine ligase